MFLNVVLQYALRMYCVEYRKKKRKKIDGFRSDATGFEKYIFVSI